MSDWVRGARSAFDLGAATNAEMSGTRAGELFLRLAENNTTNANASFSGATAPMARSLLKALAPCSSSTTTRPFAAAI